MNELEIRNRAEVLLAELRDSATVLAALWLGDREEQQSLLFGEDLLKIERAIKAAVKAERRRFTRKPKRTGHEWCTNPDCGCMQW